MKYIVLDMKWSAGMYAKKVNIDVRQISAVCLDETLHTADRFRCIADKKAGVADGQRYLEEWKEDESMEIAEGWNRFHDWMAPDALLVLWDAKLYTVIKYCDKQYRKRGKYYSYLELSRLYEAMMPEKANGETGLYSCMKELKLACDREKLKDAFHTSEYMVRLLRKLRRLGVKYAGDNFVKWMNYRQYFYIAEETYFPELVKKIQRERDTRVKKVFEEAGFSCAVSGNSVSVKTRTAQWNFELDKKIRKLHYTTSHFYRGTRTACLDETASGNLEERMGAVCKKIKETEEEFAYGVGNMEITKLVEQLGKRCGASSLPRGI